MPQTPPHNLGDRTFRFACDVVTYCRELSKEPGVVRKISWQLSDAATSAAAQYQEAKAAYSRREFASKNSGALKELREADLWLRIILTCELSELQSPKELQAEANELVAIFTTSMRRLRPIEVIRSLFSIVISFLGSWLSALTS
jgi:four helix bundle protein